MTDSVRILAVSRHRMGTDGKGITTLVGFYGCPLRCKYCINPHCFSPTAKTKEYTPEGLYEKVKIDQLYFLASGGGVTFGGGEPLCHAEFIRSFRELCGDAWNICAETSLSVPKDAVKIASECIDTFFVDCKDTNPDIYQKYTGKSNSLMLESLEYLLELKGSEHIVVRVPLIPEYNTPEDCDKSVERLTKIGVTRFDRFTYRIK